MAHNTCVNGPTGEQLGIYAQLRNKRATTGSRNITLDWLTQSEAAAVLEAADRRRQRQIQRLLKRGDPRVAHRKAS